MANNSFMFHVHKVCCGGIRADIPGHGGDECANYLDRNLMYLDTAIAGVLMVVTFIFALKTCTMPRLKDINTTEPDSKKYILMLLCLVFGIEIGYKLASEQLLYILNPCHVLTIMEIYLLVAKPSRTSIIVLRILVHYLYGALVAIVFADTHARKFYGEFITYWVQHFLIYFVIPPYIIYHWGMQSLEPLKEFAWACFTGSVMGIHHLYIMQPIALITKVNLNFVMCPSTGDPFNGPYYRIAAVGHQTLCLLFSGKIYTIGLRIFLPQQKIKKN